MPEAFRVGLTRDFLKPDGSLSLGDIGLETLDVPGVEREFLAEDTRELRPDQVRGYDALLVLAPKVTAATMEGADRLAVVARFGVGYDSVDVEALTRKGVVLTITPEGVRRPVASSVMAFLLALAHKIFVKDRITRQGRWHDRLDHMGVGLTGRVLGGIGLGNIGREVFELARPFGMRHLAYDPYVKRDGAPRDVELVDLPTLLKTADFVFVTANLTPETRHLINAERLALMKPTAHLINVSRGPLVDQRALAEALRARRIAGAALDVFEEEPVDPNDPILKLDNVILAPHAICWTDECFRGNGVAACRSILDVAAGRVPKHVVNRAAIDHPRFQETLARRARAA